MLTGDPRLSLLPILVLFLIGAALLWRVDIDSGRAAAARFKGPGTVPALNGARLL